MLGGRHTPAGMQRRAAGIGSGGPHERPQQRRWVNRMTKPFKRLRCKLLECDMRQQELADRLGVSPATISTRLSGRLPWSVPEAVQVAKILDIPMDRLSEFFYDDSPEGLAAQNETRRRAV